MISRAFGDTAFFAACAEAIGAQHVRVSSDDIDWWSRTTLHVGTRPCGVARPGSAAEVQQLVRLAGEHSFSVHPISRGRNWGYGEACAPAPGCLLLDLSRMDAIREIDPVLGFAVLEPGVSQGQLAARLEELGGAWIADCTGAGPDASVLGNLADRGFGHSPYGDRFAHACAFEVVLADGSICRTGFSGTADNPVAHVYKWGIGPSVDGLFTQSNLGIITRATVWLMPRPRARSMLLLLSDDPEAIYPLIDAVRELRLEGVLSSTIHVFNRMRLLGAFTPFPYDQADGAGALELAHPQLLAELVRRHDVPAWGATASLTGTPRLIRAAVAAVRSRLRAHRFPGRVLVVGPRTRATLRLASECVPDWAGGGFLRLQQRKLDLLWNLLAGRPDARSVSGSGWRARRTVAGSTDPRDGSAGMAWIAPVLPATRAAVAEVEALASGVLHAHGFEYQVTYSFINPRALCGVMSICFDRDDDDQRQRAAACHDALVDTLAARGYSPYRGSPPTLRRLWRHPVAPWDLLGRIRRALDPDDIISPGRYIPDRA